MVRIALIAAVADNGVIGNNNALPWHIPADLKHFKQVTMGKPIIMGRLTYESIGKVLPGRSNIVVTKSNAFLAPGVHVCHSLEAAINLAKTRVSGMRVGEVVIVGGGQIYRQAMPLVDRMYLTRVKRAVSGDAIFPAYRAQEWEKVSIGSCPATADQPACEFLMLTRRRQDK